jgi:hypothetical protein
MTDKDIFPTTGFSKQAGRLHYLSSLARPIEDADSDGAAMLRELGIAIAVMGGVSVVLGLITPGAVLQDLQPVGVARYMSREILEVILGLAAIVVGTCMAIHPHN